MPEFHIGFTTALPVSYFLLQLSAVIFLTGNWHKLAVAVALGMAGALIVFVAGIALAAPGAVLPLAMGLPVAAFVLAILWLGFVVQNLRRSVT